MSIQKVEMTVEQKENGQYVEQVAYPYVEYEHVAMENGMDILSMIRDDVSTPLATHNTTSWKIGQGDSDVSESIVDSSIASMAIKGQTYQNILPSPSLRNGMTNGKTMQKLNEGYESVNTVDGVYKSAILKGQTLVNLFDGEKMSLNESRYYTYSNGIIKSAGDGQAWSLKTNMSSAIKPMTKYLLKVKNVGEYDLNVQIRTDLSTLLHHQAVSVDQEVIKIIETGEKIDGLYVKVYPQVVGDGLFAQAKLNIIEYQDGMENWDIPYFDGMQSVKMPVLTTTGKNLFNIDDFTQKTGIPNNNGEIIFDESTIGKKYYFDVSEFPLYFSSELVNASTVGAVGIKFCYKDGSSEVCVFNTQTNSEKALIKELDYLEVCRWGTNFTVKNIQLETGVQKTSYEPYKSNILTVNEEVELRGIGDVQDTLDCLTGEVTERIGEMILDGSEDWSGWFGSVNELTYGAILTIDGKGEGVFANDRLIDSKILYGIDEVGIWNVADSRIVIRVNKIEGVDSVSAVKSFLKNEPITIQYQLATPTIKTVDLSILDQDNQPIKQLNSFANGYIQVSSQEGTPIPTTDYEVPTSNSYHVDLMKPNTQYTMKNMQGTFTIDGIQYNASVNGTFTSPSTLSNRLMITNVVQTQPMLLEGDMTSKEVPYVEGIKSTFEGVDKVEIVSQNASNSLSNTTSFQLTNPLRSLPNGVRDEIVLDRQNHKARIIQRVGEDLTQLDIPIFTEVNLEGYPYVYKGGHIFLNTEIAPITEVTYSINQAHQIESSNEDILRHQKEINHLYELIAQYVQVQYEAELIDIVLQG